MKRALLFCLVPVLALLVVAPACADVATGGGGWISQCPPPQDSNFTSVAFPDAMHGWAVGGQFTEPSTYTSDILATSDGGTSWSAQNSGISEPLSAVSFPDATHGWAVGGNTILATTDGGATWKQQYSLWGTGAQTGDPFTLSGVCFPDASHGWVVGSARIWAGNHEPLNWADVILATSDGGATWTTQYSGTETLSGVCFPDATHGWAVGYDYYTGEGVVLATSDGGATWTTQDHRKRGRQLTAVSFPDATHGWAVGTAPTASSGHLRRRRYLDTAGLGCAGALPRLFPDAKHGWAVGYGGTILSTSDGGAIWTAQSSGTASELCGVSSPTPLTAGPWAGTAPSWRPPQVAGRTLPPRRPR